MPPPRSASDAAALAVTVLGCDGSYPGPNGACSGYLVHAGSTTLWMDAGSGTLANLQRYVSVEQLDAVVISHEHPDHWTDLESFAVACRWFFGRTGVPVWAPPGLPDLLRTDSGPDTFVWHEIADGSRVEFGGARMTFSRTDHPVPTFAVRVDSADRSLGYSADTGPGWGLSQLGAGLHLALCEASFLADREGTVAHLSARQAGWSARDARVDRLVITHIGPPVDRDQARAEAEEAFGQPVEVAAIGRRYIA
jgi:ribonuclease BN (tRNA processing enzyme)